MSTVTVTPESCPVNLLPTKFSTYNETGTPKWSGSNLTEWYWESYAILPGTTQEPSLKIWLPKDSTWFCNCDCRVVNSLACTGFPGLNKTL